MNNLRKILISISFLVMLTMFTGTVSAFSWTVNPGDPITSTINNASDYDKIIVNDTNKSAYTNTKNMVNNKKAIIKPIFSNIITQAVNPSSHNINNSSENISHLDTEGIIMATTDYNCGPAALATILKNMGINATQEELAVLAGTNETGTTMYGLIQAAQAKGLIAKGLKLPVDKLRPNNIMFLTINGEGHYSVILNITNTTVYLADPVLGNIDMNLTDFTEAYIQDTLNGYGYAVIITNETNDSRLNNNNTLTEGEMQSVKGQNIIKILQLIWQYGKPVVDWAGRVLTAVAIYDYRGHIYKKLMWIPKKNLLHTKYGIILR